MPPIDDGCGALAARGATWLPPHDGSQTTIQPQPARSALRSPDWLNVSENTLIWVAGVLIWPAKPYRFVTLPRFPYVAVYNADRRPPLIVAILYAARDLPPLLRDL